MACTNVTYHPTFSSVIQKLEKVVMFNGEQVRAHPQTCGFEGTLTFNKNKCCDLSTSTNRKETMYSINSPK